MSAAPGPEEELERSEQILPSPFLPDDPVSRDIKEMQTNLASLVKWKRYHYHFDSILAHVKVIREPSSAILLGRILLKSVLNLEMDLAKQEAPSFQNSDLK